MQTLGNLLSQISTQPVSEKHVKNYWQERALQFIGRLKIPKKDHPIMFKYFKSNLGLMESICSYVLESNKVINSPTAYILYEYKRRSQGSKR